jgi:signal transduction histidine kinase
MEANQPQTATRFMMAPSNPSTNLYDSLGRWLLWASLGLALAWLLINFGLSWQWIGQPFAGFLHQNRVITESNLPGWETREPTIRQIQLTEADVILNVNGIAVFSSDDLINYIRQQEVGQPINYFLQSPTGQLAAVTLAVVRFTGQDFLQLVVIPAFFALLGLIAAAIAMVGRINSLQVRLFSLLSMAMVYALVSLPDFAVGWLFYVTFFGALAGKLILPPLLLHFLLLFPYPRPVLKNWPALLPLLYLPILPTLVYLPTLLDQPELTGYFSQFVNNYTAFYALAGLILLLEAALKAETPLARWQAGVLLAGLVLPTFLALSLNILLEDSFNRSLIFETVEQYGLIGLPIASTVAISRYQMFGLKRRHQLHTLYLGAISTALAGYFLLLAFINATTVNLDFVHPTDFTVILVTTIAFFLLRPIYRHMRQRLEQRLYGSIEDFRIGLRLFQQELLKAKSRHDLEGLVSWNIPADFRLRSAEFTAGGRPSSPYSLQLPLTVNKVPLGTLFFGAKINGEEFTEQEQLILQELQKQLALAVWSFELDEAIRSTEALTRLKSKFLANVTHELRVPLNGIINYIGFVVDGDTGPLNSEQAGLLQQALQGAEKLLHLINNILDMSKIEAGQMTLQLRPVNLADLVAETVPMAADMLCHKPVRLLTDLAPSLPDVPADRLRLRQILINLLSNAVKFTDAGTVQLKAYPENGHVIIRVSDTGQGIRAERLPTIFQQFTSERLADQTEHTGAWLSLPLTKSLVELHGGQIRVESQVKQGTTFIITLPVEQNNLTADP